MGPITSGEELFWCGVRGACGGGARVCGRERQTEIVRREHCIAQRGAIYIVEEVHTSQLGNVAGGQTSAPAYVALSGPGLGPFPHSSSSRGVEEAVRNALERH